MKKVVTTHKFIVGIIAIAAAAIMVFAVLPQLNDVTTGSNFSLNALMASACCGEGEDQRDDPGDRGGGSAPNVSCQLIASKQNVEVGDSVSIRRTISPTHGSFILRENGTQVRKENTAERANVSGYYSKTYTSAGTYTYKGSYSKSGKSKTCTVVVTVTAPPEPETPVCTLDLNTTSIFQGESATLTWTTEHANSVSFDPDIGNNALNGSESVSPLSTTLYTLTAVGDTESVQCMAEIGVLPVQPQMPTCDLVADPTSITSGSSTILTWTTTNADTVSFNPDIGSTELNASQAVSPTDDTTYILTVTGPGGTDTCSAPVIVEDKPKEDDPVCDAFSATPSSFNNGIGGEVTLNWETTDATDVSIDQGIGNVPVDGNTKTSVSTTTLFTLTAINGSKTHTCTTEVAVTIDPVTPAPTCDLFSASPSSFGSSGGNTTLTWETSNATNVSIDQGIGLVSVDGSETRSVVADTIYTLTAGDGNATTTCTTSVDVDSGGGGGGGGGSSRPRCELTADKTEIRSGEEVILTWDNTRTNDITLEDSRGNTLVDTDEGDDYDEDEDTYTVTPTRDTEYTLTAIRGSREDECTVDITIVDDVTVSETRSQPPLVAGIALSQLPYTGFEAGPLLTAIFYSLLALWSLLVTYVLVIQRGSVFGFSLANGVKVKTPAFENIRGNGIHTIAPKEDIEMDMEEETESVVAMTAPTNLPTAGTYTPTIGYQALYNENEEENEPKGGDDGEITALENHAHEARILLSSDAIRFIMEYSSTHDGRLTFLDEVIERAKASFPREEGWVVVNKDRINQLFATETQEKRAPVSVTKVKRTTRSEVKVERPRVRTETKPIGGSSLTEALLSGNVTAAYQLLGTNPLFALTDAATDLDALFRNRKGEAVQVSDLLLSVSKDISDEKLEEVIEAVTSAIDGVYKDERAAMRLAVMKAVKAVL